MGTTTVTTTGPAVHFINVEYFFRLLYDLIFGLHIGSVNVGIGNTSGLVTLAGQIWLFISVIAWIVALGACWALVYYTTRYWQLLEQENERYTTISEPEAHVQVEHSRWAYIKQLIESPQESDWRQAIIEADIMLDEVLTRSGYQGNTIGDKLKTANPDRFTTIRNAWDAHTVRNEIAHSGSAYQLTNHAAFRTIQNYEAVFRQFNEI
ncbi:MAG: protein of unknown function with transrane region [Parcubacteria group bacterium]|nr:protein of unknown function with transrane region [Parcubacteria group bacterium]